MEELLAGALDGSSDARDPMATYVPLADVERYREVRRIGRQHSGLTVAKDRGIAFVVAVDADSPGAEAGLEQGDILAQVDGRSTRPMPLWRLQSMLAGETGTELALEVLRRGITHDLTLSLDTYETRAPEMETIEDQPVVRLRRFEQRDLEAWRGLLAGLLADGVDKLLVDVRGVAGGDPGVAYAMAGLVVEGSLGELRTRDEATIHYAGRESPIWTGETVILVDQGTQGAAEIFATVLRQNGSSQLVGSPTFGLAGRQRLVSLSDGSQVLLTDAFYSGPDGEPINESLVPDVRVFDFGAAVSEDGDEVEDLALEKALELLRQSEPAIREIA